jgi:hypothetical protein
VVWWGRDSEAGEGLLRAFFRKGEAGGMEGCRLDRTLLSDIVKYEHRTVFSNAACFCCPAMPKF